MKYNYKFVNKKGVMNIEIIAGGGYALYLTEDEIKGITKDFINGQEKYMNIKEFKQVEGNVEQTMVINNKPECNTKIKLHNLVLEHKSKCDTITAMENYMSECGVLVGWEDNKDKYL